MIAQDIILVLQTTVTHRLHQSSEIGASNLPCHCDHPGQKLRCEDCPYLEAQLSRSRLLRGKG